MHGEKNPSDICTKHVPAEVLNKHMEFMNVKIEGGRAERAPELGSLERADEKCTCVHSIQKKKVGSAPRLASNMPLRRSTGLFCEKDCDIGVHCSDICVTCENIEW